MELLLFLKAPMLRASKMKRREVVMTEFLFLVPELSEQVD